MQGRMINTTIFQFDWNEGNREKNWETHAVTTTECEETFFNRPHMIARDVRHSLYEERYSLLGITNVGRLLNIIFTMRGDMIRVISARDQNKDERTVYARQVTSLSK